MTDQSSDGGQGAPGTVTIRWDKGTVEVYTIPATDLPSFDHTGNVVKFRAFKAGQVDGLVLNLTFNFDKMMGYEKSWL